MPSKTAVIFRHKGGKPAWKPLSNEAPSVHKRTEVHCCAYPLCDPRPLLLYTKMLERKRWKLVKQKENMNAAPCGRPQT